MNRLRSRLGPRRANTIALILALFGAAWFLVAAYVFYSLWALGGLVFVGLGVLLREQGSGTFAYAVACAVGTVAVYVGLVWGIMGGYWWGYAISFCCFALAGAIAARSE